MCHAEGSEFTCFHQLSINGKISGFDRQDIKHLAKYAGLPRGSENRILEQTLETFSSEKDVATELDISGSLKADALRSIRMDL